MKKKLSPRQVLPTPSGDNIKKSFTKKDNKMMRQTQQFRSPTQCDLLLDYLRTKGPITSFEAVQKLGISRLASRVYDLRQAGIPIVSIMLDHVSTTGRRKKIAKYFLRHQRGGGGSEVHWSSGKVNPEKDDQGVEKVFDIDDLRRMLKRDVKCPETRESIEKAYWAHEQLNKIRCMMSIVRGFKVQ